MLGIWEYFWDWGGVAAPAPIVLPPTPGRGSGHSTSDSQYQLAPDEYWEAYSKRHAPKNPSDDTVTERKERLLREHQQILGERQQLLELSSAHQNILAQMAQVSSVIELKTLADYSKRLASNIAELETTYKARIIRAKMLQASLYH